MTEKNRVLAYEKATELKDSDLIAVSGGNTKFTCSNIARATGYYPGPMDIEVIQTWD